MLTKIISGGQTGADRAALDVAIELGIPHGGWVPKLSVLHALEAVLQVCQSKDDIPCLQLQLQQESEETRWG